MGGFRLILETFSGFKNAQKWAAKSSLTRSLEWNSKIPSMPMKLSYWGASTTNLSQFGPGVWAVGGGAIDFRASTSCNSGTSVDPAGCRSLDLKQKTEFFFLFITYLRNLVHFPKNKAVYTAALVAWWWAGAVNFFQKKKFFKKKFQKKKKISKKKISKKFFFQKKNFKNKKFKKKNSKKKFKKKI